MKRILFITILLSVAFIFPALANEVIQEEGLNGVILTDQDDLVWPEAITTVNHDAPTDYWVPSKEQILVAESKLKTFLQGSPEIGFPIGVDEENSSGYRKIWEYLEDYYRQYIGFIVKSEKKIYFNCVAKWAHSKDGWESKLDVPFLMGGGIYRFEAIYDVSKDAFVELEVTDGGPE